MRVRAFCFFQPFRISAFQNFSFLALSVFQRFRMFQNFRSSGSSLRVDAHARNPDAVAQTTVVPPRPRGASVSGRRGCRGCAGRTRCVLPTTASASAGGTFGLRASFEAEYDDNVFWTQLNPKADLVLQPRIDLDAYWRMTELNTLTLNLGVRYEYYLDNHCLNSDAPLISPRIRAGL